MRTGKISLVVAALLVASTTVATADTTPTVAPISAPSRADQIAAIHAKYDALFDSEAARLKALAPKVKLDTQLERQYKSILLDFNTMHATIYDGLASDTSDVEAMGQLAEEETGEFASWITGLEQSVLKIKSLTCVKGKVTKKVTGINAACPKGYTKKK